MCGCMLRRRAWQGAHAELGDFCSEATRSETQIALYERQLAPPKIQFGLQDVERLLQLSLRGAEREVANLQAQAVLPVICQE